MLESLITSKTRLRLLIKFFVNITNKGYLNSLANEFGESTNSVRKELNNLSSAGYLEKHNQNNKVIYSANASHPLFKIIQKTIHKHLGIEEILETVYNRIGDVEKVVLLSGDGDFDLLVRKVINKYGCIVDVYGVRGLTANSLIESASKFYPISENFLV